MWQSQVSNKSIVRGICSSSSDDQVCERLKCLFEPLAKAYEQVCKDQAKDKEFFGLRDFYRYY